MTRTSLNNIVGNERSILFESTEILNEQEIKQSSQKNKQLESHFLDFFRNFD